MRTHHLSELPPHWRPAADVFAALGDETRQKILLLFEPGEELSIKDIAARFPFGRTTVVHHLNVLEKAGILAARRSGRLALYTLCHAPVLDALEKLRLLIEDDLSGATPRTMPDSPEPEPPEPGVSEPDAKSPPGRDVFFLSTYLS